MIDLLVDDCIKCGGFCCKGITLNSGRSVSSFFQRINGEELLMHNPFAPLHELLLIASTPIDYYRCSQLDWKTGLCKDHENRPEMCVHYPSSHDDELVNFIFIVPWCTYREKQLILKGEVYRFATLSECMHYYGDPITSTHTPALTLLDCHRFVQYYLSDRIHKAIFPSVPNDFFAREVFSSYLAHFTFEFKKQTIRMRSAPAAFNRMAMLCYKHGVTPEIFCNTARLFGESKNLLGKVPFPTFIVGDKFEEFLVERLKRYRLREMVRSDIK